MGAGVRSGPFLCSRVTLRKVLIKPIFCLSSSICRAGMKLLGAKKVLSSFAFWNKNILLYSPAPRPYTLLLLHLSDPVAGWQPWFMDLATLH